MTASDPLDGYRGNDLNPEIAELLAAAGVGGENSLMEAAQKLNEAQQITEFLQGTVGKALLVAHDEAVSSLLKGLTAVPYDNKAVKALCEDYRIKAWSFGLLLGAVQDAAMLQHRLEQEQLMEQLSTSF